MDYAPIERFALRHHGIVSTEIFVELGGTRSGWRWALESGRLHAVHPGVARFPGAPLTTDAQILAAVWASGPAALASHRAAAEVWCPVSALALVDVVVPRRYRRRPLRGVLIHRPRDDGDLRPSLWRNIPVANPLRTLVDLGAVDPDGVRGCLERMVIAGFVSPAAFAQLSIGTRVLAAPASPRCASCSTTGP